MQRSETEKLAKTVNSFLDTLKWLLIIGVVLIVGFVIVAQFIG